MQRYLAQIGVASRRNVHERKWIDSTSQPNKEVYPVCVARYTTTPHDNPVLFLQIALFIFVLNKIVTVYTRTEKIQMSFARSLYPLSASFVFLFFSLSLLSLSGSY